MKTVQLTKQHRHGGTQYAVGALLTLNDRTAEWLIEQGVARSVAASTGASALTRSQPAAPRVKRGCCGGKW